MGQENKKINITYLGGGWPTNIGNAFIDKGSLYSLKLANPNANIYFASEMPQWFYYFSNKNYSKAFNLASVIKSDYIVISGMMLCEEFVKLYESVVSKAIKNGAKFIINGGGGEKYDPQEVSAVRNFLKRCPPLAFISRDDVSFKNYQNLAKYSYNGIDVGFFISDCFPAANLNLSNFAIFNFDQSIFRELFSENNKIKKELKSQISEDCIIINTYHSCWPKTRFKDLIISLFFADRYIYQANTLISDIPEDYLQLYANAKATYSNRVHACIAALSYGKKSRLFSRTKRALLFDRIGLRNIQKELVEIDINKFQQEKNKQVEFLTNIFKMDKVQNKKY
jgi:hypothetical protein